MDFTYTPEQEKFRAELRRWLEKNSAEAFGRTGEGLGGSTASLLDVRDDGRWNQLFDYHRRLYQAGYVALHWPKEWGGGGASMIDQAIYQDEVLRLGAAALRRQSARDRSNRPDHHASGHRAAEEALPAQDADRRGNLVPGLFGTRRGLRSGAPCRRARCSTATPSSSTGRRYGPVWRIARTGRCCWCAPIPAAPKHKGISYLLVDMHSPGITVRPLVQITGDAGFNEVFYDNVRVPKENLVGELNAGWQVSIATLMYERVSGGTRHPVERTIGELLELAKKVDFEGGPAWKHPYVRQKLAQFATEARCLRLSRYRSLSAQLKGKVPGAESSFGKLFATELNLRVAMFADEMLGAFANVEGGSLGAVEGGRWMHRTLAARGLTIAAGSSEIQHNIIGERVLKLPKG